MNVRGKREKLDPGRPHRIQRPADIDRHRPLPETRMNPHEGTQGMSRTLPYGYIRMTEGTDGDCYLQLEEKSLWRGPIFKNNGSILRDSTYNSKGSTSRAHPIDHNLSPEIFEDCSRKLVSNCDQKPMEIGKPAFSALEQDSLIDSPISRRRSRRNGPISIGSLFTTEKSRNAIPRDKQKSSKGETCKPTPIAQSLSIETFSILA